MAIRIGCKCGRALAVKDELAGATVRCPQCKGTLQVPERETGIQASTGPSRRYAEDDEPRSRRRERLDDDDDRPVRRRRDSDDDDDDRPTRRRRDREEDDDEDRPLRRRDADDEEPRKKKKKRKREAAPQSEGTHPMVSVGVGLLMMVGAVAWFVAGLFAGYIYFYPPILFISGAIAMGRGLMQSGE